MRGISLGFEKTPPPQPLLDVSASPTVRIRISPIGTVKQRTMFKQWRNLSNFPKIKKKKKKTEKIPRLRTVLKDGEMSAVSKKIGTKIIQPSGLLAGGQF